MPIREFVSHYHQVENSDFAAHKGTITVDLDDLSIWIHDGTARGGISLKSIISRSTEVVLHNNVSSPTPILSFPLQFSNANISFSSTKENSTDFGTIYIFHDGTTPSWIVSGGTTDGSTGINLSVTLTSTVNLCYTTTNGSGDGSMTMVPLLVF